MEYVFPCAELEYLHCSSNKAFITDDISVFLPVGVTVVVPSLLKNKFNIASLPSAVITHLWTFPTVVSSLAVKSVHCLFPASLINSTILSLSIKTPFLATCFSSVPILLEYSIPRASFANLSASSLY